MLIISVQVCMKLSIRFISSHSFFFSGEGTRPLLRKRDCAWLSALCRSRSQRQLLCISLGLNATNVVLVRYYSTVTFVCTFTFTRACTASARHISGAYGFQCSWHSVYTVCLTLWQEHCSLQVLMCLVLVTRSLLTVKVSPKVHIAETASGSNAVFNASK